MLILQWEYLVGCGIALVLGMTVQLTVDSGRLTRAAAALRAVMAERDELAGQIQWYKDAYANDREIMADNAAQLASYEARLAVRLAELAVLRQPAPAPCVDPDALLVGRPCGRCYGTGEADDLHSTCWNCNGRGFIAASPAGGEGAGQLTMDNGQWTTENLTTEGHGNPRNGEGTCA